MVSHVSGQPYLVPDDIPAELLSQSPEMAADAQAVGAVEPVDRGTERPGMGKGTKITRPGVLLQADGTAENDLITARREAVVRVIKDNLHWEKA